MIELKHHANGIVLPVRAQPGARKAGILGVRAGALRVAVTAPADDGRANAALVELLRDVLALKRSQVELLGGFKSRDKTFLLRGLSEAEVLARVGSLLGDPEGSKTRPRA